MEDTKDKVSNFTIVPNNNNQLYNKNPAFNILHVYIVERVRSFDKKNKTCYIKNEQLAEATGSSEKTISRAIKLLVNEKVLWAGYHYKTENDKITKQRVLRIYNEDIEAYYNKRKEKETDKKATSNKIDNLSEGQNVQESETNCLPQTDKMTAFDGQSVLLEYNNNTKENNYKNGEELDSSLLDSHNAHPELEAITSNLFGEAYNGMSKNQRKSLEEIEESLYDIEDDEI